MTAVTYTAKRSLIAGHVVGTAYSLDLQCLQSTPGPTRTPTIASNEALSGQRETLRFNAVLAYDINLAPLSGAKLAAVIEFLDSVEAGEMFLFDFYGSVATPVSPKSVSLEPNGYSLPRHTAVGGGGGNDYFTVTFRVREVQS